MTYSETEVRPGPNLNMVLGPNGTGKSAIVCCIIVGLAGEVGLTGRGASPADFVKRNTDWATTYIELYNNKGPNYSVERKISITNRSRFKIDHKSEWKINGKPCLKSEVQALTKKLNIKVDNLCQFLPQDSVTQFVKMNSRELLNNTLKAAGDNQLVDDHLRLVTLTEEVSGKRAEASKIEKLCKENEVNVRRLEADVHQLRQREELVKEKSICSEKIYYAKYKEARNSYDEAKLQCNTLSVELEEIEAQSEPFKQKVDSSKAEEVKVRLAFKTSVDEVKTSLKSTERTISDIEDGKIDCQQEYSKFREKQTEENRREMTIRLKEQEIETYEAKLHDLRDVDCTRQIAQVKGELEEITAKMKSSQQVKMQLDEKIRNQLTAIRDTEREDEAINAVKNKRMFLLKTQNTNAYRVSEWLSTNKEKFKKRIYLPLMCEINVKDQKYSHIVESAISKPELVAFVCQTKEDLLTLTRLVRDQMKISINVILAPDESMDEKFRRQQTELPDCRDLGVKNYLIDMIDAPGPIMRYLCGTYNFHRIPVAGDCSEQQLKGLCDRCPKFYASNQLHTVNRSRYDDQKIHVQEPVRAARSLIYSLDKEKSDECRRRLDNLRRAHEQANNEKEDLLKKDDELKRTWQTLNERHAALTNKQSERTRLQTVIKINREQLEKLKTEKIDLVTERAKLQKSIEKINLRILGHLEKLSRIYEKVALHKKDTMRNMLSLKIAIFNHKLALKKFTTAQSDTTRLQGAIVAKKQEVSTLKSQLYTALAIAGEKIKGFKDGALSRSTKARFSTIAMETVEDLSNKLEDLSVRIQRIYQDSDNTVLNEFNRLNEQLKDKRYKLDELQTSIKQIDDELESIKQRWVPKLQDVIESIDTNYGQFMRKLNYDGKVQLDYDPQQPNNFAVYGIMILVKYRDREALIPLSSTRQSGGERSVATMIYMLALQAKTSVPFRCVDEINQGMDKENERKVFELLVSTADSSSSQYFLVSPKLLSNLPYSKKMTIHVVFNGNKVNLSWNDLTSKAISC